MASDRRLRRLAYGTWPSPVSAAGVASGRVSLSDLQVGAGRCWWSESRPAEGGRQVVVSARLPSPRALREARSGEPVPSSGGGAGQGSADEAPAAALGEAPEEALGEAPAAGLGEAPLGRAAASTAGPRDAVPTTMDVRSRVHEYGGGSFTVLASGDLVVVDAHDGGLWLVAAGTGSAPSARRLTPTPPVGERHRYGDVAALREGQWVVAIRERCLARDPERDHLAVRPGNQFDEVVAVAVARAGEPVVLASGHDFYAAPRPSPDGRRLAFVQWDHPRMPWDGSELVVCPLDLPGAATPLDPPATVVAGGAQESVGQPLWVGEDLWFMCDRHDFWQPWRWRGHGAAVRMCDVPADCHAPDWVLGQRTMAALPDGTMALRLREGGRDELAILDPTSGALCRLDQPYVHISALATNGDTIVLIGATDNDPSAVATVALDGTHHWLHRPTPAPLDRRSVSIPVPTRFPTVEGIDAQMLVYGPTSTLAGAPTGSLPPLLVLCHGGPTASAERGLDPQVQFWTSRGFMVAAVDYRGSSGYGRRFRQLLNGRWGEADAEDVASAARFLVSAGAVDPRRLVVRGSSSGGLTALRAASTSGPFAAAIVVYGVTDLRALRMATHRFEAHYLDTLVGPWPETAGRYATRSPLLHPELVGASVLLVHGSDDTVVPAAQSAQMASELRLVGAHVVHRVLAGEGHGFRRAASIEQALDEELQFVTDVLESS